MKSVAIFLLGLFLSFSAMANGGEGESEKATKKGNAESIELAKVAAEKEAMQEIIRMGVPDDFKAATPIPKKSQSSTYELKNLADKETLRSDFIPSTAPSYGVGFTVPLKK